MTTPKWLPWAICAILLIILLFIKCNPDEESTKTTTTIKDVQVEVPSHSGIFDKPNNQSEIPSSGKDSIVYFDKIIYVESAVNDELVQKYKNAKTEVDKLNAYLDGIRQREYNSDYEDSLVNIKAHTTVYGELKTTNLSYTLKPRKVTVQEKTTVIEKTVIQKDNFGILGLGGVAKDLDTQDMIYEAGAGIRLGKLSVLATGATNKTVGLKAIIEF